MATPTSQRVGIWIIAVVMVVGTIGSFAVMILANQNQQRDYQEQQKVYEQFQKRMEEQQKKAAADAKKYYPTFKKYENAADSFDPKTVGKTVETKDLKVGTGPVLDEKSSFSAYYIGWNPDGKVFDSSFEGASLKPAFQAAPGGAIEGWAKGVKGMKVGGIRELTIPAELAYGKAGQGEDIPPNTPLKFIIYVVKKS